MIGRVISDKPINLEPGVRVGPIGYAGLVCANILLFIGLFSLAAALPAVKAQFEATPYVNMLTELVGASSGFAFALGSLGIGPLIVRFGYRSIYLVSLAAFAIAGACGPLASNLYVIIASRVLVGLASAGITNAALVAIGRLLSPSAQARVLGLQTLIGGVVAIAAFPLIGQLAAADWRLAFVPHLLSLVFVPLVLALPRVSRVDQPANAAARSFSVGRLVVFSAIFTGMVIFACTMFGPLFLVGIGVTNPTLLSIPPTAGPVGTMTGSALYVAFRPKLGLVGAFAVAFCLMAAGLVVVGMAHGVWGVAGGSLLTLLGCGLFTPNLNSAAIVACPDNPGPALGVVNALLYGSMILFPLIATPLAAAMGGPRWVLLGGAGIACLLALMFVVGGGVLQIPVESPPERLQQVDG